MLIDNYMNSLREDAEIYDEAGLNRNIPEGATKGAEKVSRKANRKADFDKAIGAAGEFAGKHWKKAAIGAGVAGAAGLGAMALKKHRAKKAQEVAVEEGVSLEEAMSYVLECEQEYLNEGYDFADIYDIED